MSQILILGKKFALQTLISTFYYPFILGVFELSFQGFYLTDDILINTLFAGVLVGVAIPIVIKPGATIIKTIKLKIKLNNEIGK